MKSGAAVALDQRGHGTCGPGFTLTGEELTEFVLRVQVTSEEQWQSVLNDP